MTALETARLELTELRDLIQAYHEADVAEWSAEWVTLQSLYRREAQLHRQFRLLSGDADVEVVVSGGAERRNRVDASFLGTFLMELHASVEALVQAIMHGEQERGEHPADVLSSASLLVGSAAPTGSLVVSLEGPADRPAQTGTDGTLTPPPFDEAIGRLLDVFDASAGDDRTQLVAAITGLGSRRAQSHVTEIARAFATTGTRARVVHRSSVAPVAREASITPEAAARLRAILTETVRTTRVVEMVGRLSGVRWGSGIFDLEIGEGAAREAISGRVVADLRETVRAGVFDNIVRAELEETVITAPIDEEPRLSYRLIGVRLLGDDQSHDRATLGL